MECTEWKNDPGASAPPIRRAPHELIHGTGEMADLTRAFDWSETPVGPIEEWPDTLLITVNTLLASRFPMFLWWGEELTQFYNDAYRVSPEHCCRQASPGPWAQRHPDLARDLANYRP
jgi:hypothetical protein